jgi:hypothetical protein
LKKKIYTKDTVCKDDKVIPEWKVMGKDQETDEGIIEIYGADK